MVLIDVGCTNDTAHMKTSKISVHVAPLVYTEDMSLAWLSSLDFSMT